MKCNMYFTNRKTGECKSREELTAEERKEIGRKLNIAMLEAAGATPMKEDKTAQAVRKGGTSMKVRDIVLVLITAILLIWLIGSWMEVQIAAVDNWQHTYCPLNMFVMLCEAMR